MIVNVAEAKSTFSSLISRVGVGDQEIVIAKRDKPMAVLISYDTFMSMKKQNEKIFSLSDIAALPSSLDHYKGIISESDIDDSYRQNREAYLEEKYL